MKLPILLAVLSSVAFAAACANNPAAQKATAGSADGVGVQRAAVNPAVSLPSEEAATKPVYAGTVADLCTDLTPKSFNHSAGPLVGLVADGKWRSGGSSMENVLVVVDQDGDTVESFYAHSTAWGFTEKCFKTTGKVVDDTIVFDFGGGNVATYHLEDGEIESGRYNYPGGETPGSYDTHRQVG